MRTEEEYQAAVERAEKAERERDEAVSRADRAEYERDVLITEQQANDAVARDVERERCARVCETIRATCLEYWPNGNECQEALTHAAAEIRKGET